MTTPVRTAYTFLPWVQSGIGRSIAAADDPGVALSARTVLPVTLKVEGAGDVSTTVRLYGPGDVTGVDPAQIVRRDPAPGTTQFEAGYMPQIQFARADLPWLFTPAAPGSSATRLRPWLVLLAVRRQPSVKLVSNLGGPLPVLELDTPATELPDLSQSWAWAHAQIAGLGAGDRPADVLTTDPGRACSRLVCPRHLEPNTSYLACLVPAFLAGVKAGLGESLATADLSSLEPAWEATTTDSLRLPVYHSWEFSTGPAGSFETLVRRLHPSPLDAISDNPLQLDLRTPGGGLPAAGAIGMQSALRVPGPNQPPEWPEATRVPFQKGLEKALTATAANVLAPPLYGQLQTAADALPPAGAAPAWLREVNLDPRLRAAAAAGTRVVQARQEQLMARAWDQAGAANEANALLRRSQLSRELGGVIVERHLAALSATALLDITQPAHAQLQLTNATVSASLQKSRIPASVVSGTMRRMASTQGLIARRAQQAGPIDMLAAVDQMAMAPAATGPDGMMGMLSFVAPPATVDTRPAVSTEALRGPLLQRVAPDTTVLERARTRIDAPAGTWTRPDPLAQVTTGPEFADPMYEAMHREAPALFFPGIERLEADGVALLETTPRVIEAFLVGLNHEFSRELLWREFPSALTGTSFRHFWDMRGQSGDPESLADIPPISEWADGPLGTHLRGGGEQLVLVVRGELLRRSPTTTIYAARATPVGDALDEKTRLAPLFRAGIAPDIVFVGFPLSEENALAQGWFFVFEEHPGAPRFGFDEVPGPGVPNKPDALAWAHVPLTPSGYADVSKPLAAGPALLPLWGRSAADMAALTFQRPFRVAMHASRLLRGSNT